MAEEINMSHSVAQKLTKETGFDIKYNRTQQAYIVYPLEIFCYNLKQLKEACNFIEEELCVI